MILKPGDTPKPEKGQKSQKKAKKGQKPATFYIWQIARNEREKNEPIIYLCRSHDASKH